MNEIVAGRSAGQPSQASATGSLRCTVEKAASGTKKRTKMFPGGNNDTTGAPAATVSPARASTSVTRPLAAAVTLREPPLGHSERWREAATAACWPQRAAIARLRAIRVWSPLPALFFKQVLPTPTESSLVLPPVRINTLGPEGSQFPGADLEAEPVVARNEITRLALARAVGCWKAFGRSGDGRPRPGSQGLPLPPRGP